MPAVLDAPQPKSVVSGTPSSDVGEYATASRAKPASASASASPPAEVKRAPSLRSAAPPPEVAPQRGASVRNTHPRLASSERSANEAGGAVDGGGNTMGTSTSTRAQDGTKRPQSMRAHGDATLGGGDTSRAVPAAAKTGAGVKRPQSMGTHAAMAETSGSDKPGGKVNFDLASVKVHRASLSCTHDHVCVCVCVCVCV